MCKRASPNADGVRAAAVGEDGGTLSETPFQELVNPRRHRMDPAQARGLLAQIAGLLKAAKDNFTLGQQSAERERLRRLLVAGPGPQMGPVLALIHF